MVPPWGLWLWSWARWPAAEGDISSVGCPESFKGKKQKVSSKNTQVGTGLIPCLEPGQVTRQINVFFPNWFKLDSKRAEQNATVCWSYSQAEDLHSHVAPHIIGKPHLVEGEVLWHDSDWQARSPVRHRILRSGPRPLVEPLKICSRATA